MAMTQLQTQRPRRSMRTTAAWAAGLLATTGLLVAGVAPASAAPFSNGSFETPVIGPTVVEFGTTTPAGPNIGPWTVVPAGETVDIVRAPTFPVSDGNQSIDIVGTTGPGAGVQQTFDTVSGTGYLLTYDVAGLCSGNLNTKINGTQVDTVSVAAGQPFATRTVTFTATGPSTTLLFDSSVSGSNVCGAGLDNVRLAPVVAVPIADAKLAGGAIGGVLMLTLGIVLYRRRSPSSWVRSAH